MHLIEFYYKLARFSDFLPILPILMGLVKWKKLSLGLKCFMGFLLSDLLVNWVSYNIKFDNRFLSYFYSFFYCLSIISTYFFFFKDDKEKKIVLILLGICNVLVVVDFLFVDRVNENFFSGMLIDFVIISISIYYFSRYFIQRKQYFIEANLFISIVLIFQFIIKLVEEFLDNFLTEMQNTGMLWIQMRNIYYFFMIIFLLIITFIYYKHKLYEQKK